MHTSTWIKAVAVTASIALLGACSGGPANNGGTAEKTSGEGKTLSLWIMEGTNSSSDTYISTLKEKFKAKTGADLDVQLQPWANAHDKFVTAIAGGTAPDVAEIGTTWTPEFADLGALSDLTSRVGDTKSDLVTGLVDAGTLNGKLYGMPWYAGIRSFIYNKELFQKAGITTPPQSWDDLLSAIDKLKALDGVIPFPIAGSSQFGLIPFIWGAGGELATRSGDAWTSSLDSTPSVEGLKFYTDLALTHNSSTPAANTWKETDALKAFEEGNVGMIISGSWTLSKIKEDAPDFISKVGAFGIPGKDGKMARSFAGGSHLGIFASSENQDLAWELVQLMTVGDLAQQWAEESNYFPGDAKLLDAYLNSGDELTQVFARQMKEASASVPVTPKWGAVEGAQVIPTLLQEVLTGKKDAATAAKDAAATMNDVFSK
ncbi:MAG: sugar ABC transporter substrate-binding protein [Arcanobacterium sp.]|nr:sugar ABC transporter substrate-binding protein [Arcanobacterium sp.]